MADLTSLKTGPQFFGDMSKGNSSNVNITSVANDVFKGIIGAINDQSAEVEALKAANKRLEQQLANFANSANNGITGLIKNQDDALKAANKNAEHQAVASMAAERKHRVEQAALQADMDKLQTLGGVFKDMIKGAFDKVCGILKDGFKKSLDSFSALSASMRKMNLSQSQKDAIGMSSKNAISEIYKSFGKNVSLSEANSAIEALLKEGKDVASMEQGEINKFIALAASGEDTLVAYNKAMLMSTEQVDKEVNALSDITTNRLIKDISSKYTDTEKRDRFGGQDRASEQIIATAQGFTKTIGKMADEDSLAAMSKAFLDFQTGNFAGVDKSEVENALIAFGTNISDIQSMTAEQMGEKIAQRFRDAAGDKSKLTELSRQFYVLQKGQAGDTKLLDSLARMQEYIESHNGGDLGKHVRDYDENRAAMADSSENGLLLQGVDRAVAGLDSITGGFITKTSNTLDKWFGGTVTTDDVMKDGFTNTVSAIKAIHRTMLFSPITKWLGGKLGPVFGNVLTKFGGKLGGRFGGLLTKLGGTMTGATTAATGAANAAEAAAAASKATTVAANAGKATAAASNVGKSAGLFSKIGGFFSKAAGPLSKGMSVVTKFSGAFLKLLGPIGWVITAFQAGFAAGKWLVKTLFPDVYLEVEKAGGYLNSVIEIGKFIWEDILVPLKDNYIVPFFTFITNAIGDNIKIAADIIGYGITELIPAVAGQLVDVGTNVFNVITNIKDVVGAGIDYIVAYFGTGITILQNMPGILIGNIKANMFENAGNLLKNLGIMLSKSKLFSGDVANTAIEAGDDLISKAEGERELVKSKQAEIEAAVTNLQQKEEAFNKSVDQLKDAISGLKDSISKVGDTEQSFLEYHKESEDKRVAGQKRLEEYERKKAEEQAKSLSTIAENTTPEDDTAFITMGDGGVKSEATKAIVGEAGKEVIFPLTRPEQISKILKELSKNEKLLLLRELIKSGQSLSIPLLSDVIFAALSNNGSSDSDIKGTVSGSVGQTDLSRKILEGAAAQKGHSYTEMVCNQMVEAALKYAGFKLPTTGSVYRHFNNPAMKLVLNDPVNGISATDPALVPGMIMFSHPFTQDEAVHYNNGKLKPRKAGDPGHMGIYAGDGLWWNSTSSKNFVDFSTGKGIKSTASGVALTKPMAKGTYKLFAAGYYDGMFDDSVANKLPTAQKGTLFDRTKEQAEKIFGNKEIPSESKQGTENLLTTSEMISLISEAGIFNAPAMMSYIEQAKKLAGGKTGKDDIMAVLLEIARYLRGMSSSKIAPVSRPMSQVYGVSGGAR